MKYKAIFERNADRLVNANTIYEGQVIVLPVCMESSTVSVTKVPPLMVSAVPDLMPFWLVESVSSVSVCFRLFLLSRIAHAFGLYACASLPCCNGEITGIYLDIRARADAVTVRLCGKRAARNIDKSLGCILCVFRVREFL